ncbi:MAG: phosphoribosylformylglycinamidine synthase, partial [Clostridia bacterium]|nr:phosphoribosylformylglycinamidine synthase [Clostridia bacterium]
MVYRVFVSKKPEHAFEEKALMQDAREFLGVKTLEGARIYNRYDAEGITEELFSRAVNTVFSEPQVDYVFYEIKDKGDALFAVEFLPGQFDQRADSAAQCIQLISQGEKPRVSSAKVYVLYGKLSESDINVLKKH